MSELEENAGASVARVADPILEKHRVVAAGMTGTGKSQVLLCLFADDPGQRVLIDVNDAYELGPATLEDPYGWQETDDPREIDWRLRTIRIVPPLAGRAAREWYDDVYAAIWDRSQRHEDLGPLTVLLDESVGPTSASYAPPHLLLAVTQGRKQRLRHMAAMQEVFNVEPLLLSQAEHGFFFDPGGRPDNHDRIGQRLGWSGRDVAEEFRLLAEQYGYEDDEGNYRCHAYLRHRLGRREVHAFPPLPAEALQRADRHVINAT